MQYSASGIPHQELFESIGFKGSSYITGSVGIFNKSDKIAKVKNFPLKYIFVGRLIEAKEVEFLVDTFNENGLALTIVGDGVLKNKLIAKAKSNITFAGFIPNEQIGRSMPSMMFLYFRQNMSLGAL